MRIIQFTDTHLGSERGELLHGVDTQLSLRKSFEKALSLNIKPDAIFVTGDISEIGSSDSYLLFKQIFAESHLPVFVLPGNHDDTSSMSKVFFGSNVTQEAHAIRGDWLFIFVNSQVLKKSHGFIEPEELVRIENLLTSHADKWVMLSLHHPPRTECPTSGCQLKNADELLAVLSRFKNVKVILSGHLHTELDLGHQSLRMLTAPSTFALCRHPRKGDDVDVENFWASHTLLPSRQGFRSIDLLKNGEFKTEVHWL